MHFYTLPAECCNANYASSSVLVAANSPDTVQTALGPMNVAEQCNWLGLDLQYGSKRLAPADLMVELSPCLPAALQPVIHYS